VLREGIVRAGDALEPIGRDPHGVGVVDVVRLYAFEPEDLDGLRRAVRAEALPESWRGFFQKRIDKLVAQGSEPHGAAGES
jgi:MOSC domain-containing protein YiiM